MNILGFSNEVKQSSETNDEKLPCDYCKKRFFPEVLLKHIGGSDACKSHYGPKFKEIKKENHRNRMALWRQENGTRRELDQQKKAYNLNPELKEKKKNRYEDEKRLQKIRDKEESKRREKIFTHQMLEFFTIRKLKKGIKKSITILLIIQRLWGEALRILCHSLKWLQ